MSTTPPQTARPAAYPHEPGGPGTSLTPQIAAVVAAVAARHMVRTQNVAAVYAVMLVRRLEQGEAPSPNLRAMWRETDQTAREWALTWREAEAAYRAAVRREGVAA